MPLRIALFAPYDLARDGGVGNQIRAQAHALERLGHNVQIFGPASAPLSNGETAVCGSFSVTVSGTESGLGLAPTSAPRVARILARGKFDIVHVHEPLTPIMPWFALGTSRAPLVGTFHVHREHGHPFYPFAWPLLAPLMRRLKYRIAVSDAARRTIAHTFPGNYDIIPNGIDVEAFRTPRPRPASIEPGRQHVLYVGRLEPRKGVDHLIRAMRLVQQHCRARLLVVGDGPDRDQLQTLAQSLAVDAMFAGRVPDADLPAYFQWSDVLASPALGGESFGIVLLEAMASGTPVVASRIDGYADLLGDTGAGRLVPPGDPEALAAALEALLADDNVRREAGGRGVATAARYDWTVLASRLVGIYKGLLRR